MNYELHSPGKPVPGDHSECGPDCCITGDRCDGTHVTEKPAPVNVAGDNCIAIKDGDVFDAVAAIKKLAGMMPERVVGVGVWEGSITSKANGTLHDGNHIGVFTEYGLLAPFGPHGDAESEALAVLVLYTIQNAGKIDKAFTLMRDFIEHMQQAPESGFTIEAANVLNTLKELA